MKFVKILIVAITLATGYGTPCLASDAKIGTLSVNSAWARPSIGKRGNSAAYMVIKNAGPMDRLISASSPQAGKVELHNHIRDGDIMRMRQVEGGVPVPAHGSVSLQPGSYHVMFIGLKTGFKEGDMVMVNLRFEKAGEVLLHMPIKKDGTMPKGDMKTKHKHN